MYDYRKIAQTYIEKFNLPVTPVKGKVPMIKDWPEVVGSSVLADSFEDTWIHATGVGLLCGKPSGIICLDVDILESDTSLLSFREELIRMLPPMFLGKVGNKGKLPSRFFSFNGEEARKWVHIKVELLSTGNQTVMPYSIHPEHGMYEWADKSIKDIDIDELPKIPPKLLEFLDAENEKVKALKRASRVKAKNDKANGIVKEENSYTEPVDTKGRCAHNSHTLISNWALAQYRKKRISLEELASAVINYDKVINAKSDYFYFNCPSRKEWRGHREDIRANAIIFCQEIFDRNPDEWGKDYQAALNNVDNSVDDVDNRHPVDVEYAEELASGFTHTEISDNGRERVVRHYFELKNYLIKRRFVKYLPEARVFAWWNGRHFEYLMDEHLKKFAQDHFDNPKIINPGERQRFLELIKSTELCHIDDFVMSDKGIINLRNGIYLIGEKRLIPHDPSYRMMNFIDVDYDENALCPTWDELLTRVCMSRPSYIKAIEEFIGYALSGCSYDRFNKILILDGEGSNGKSTILSVIKELLGLSNITATTLKDVSTKQFAAFNLVNKMINFCSEESKDAFSDTGMLKRLTGNDPIMAEAKHRGAFPYVNMAKFIITYNKMPFFPDDSTGMKRRIILIPCEQNFDLYPELKIRDPVKTIVGNELPGVLIKCIRAYEAVLSRGHFTRVADGEARVEEMIEESSPIAGFIDEELSFGEPHKFYETNEALWTKFKEFTGNNTSLKKNTFLKKLRLQLDKRGNFTYSVKRVGEKIYRVIEGVKILYPR